ncbi:2-amino-3-carboxymuconate-6-semialdehyde decarboxylase [Purpureocillium lilacinum]|uniref:6-methylsalicylate decarboxylase n=1 Tax=Purpureocillium lilacinum TaxID=33203 RepID=A0A179GER8_PURLI|nr:2-amino-3-carboxymuconate-6-semialdehyde decarboxylase [Purpureocillium lilacinum]OAQ75853.1 2-amino-3-carboxymuconate-6-semialdehyde decarboxylase [Purpureocillium lilacinum]
MADVNTELDIVPATPNLGRIHRSGGKVRGFGRDDYHRFRNLSPWYICAAEKNIGAVHVDCRLLLKKSKLGVFGFGVDEQPGGIIYFNLDISQPPDCSLSEATIEITFDQESGFIRQHYAESTSTKPPQIPVQVATWGPTKLTGEKRTLTVESSANGTASIQFPGGGIGGVGLDKKRTVERCSRWALNSSLVRGKTGKLYQGVKWTLAANKFDKGSQPGGNLYTAFSFQYDGEPFLMKNIVLESIAGAMTHRVSHSGNTSRIDTHIHVLTPSYLAALDEAGGDPSGWATPNWTLEECVRFSDTIGSSFSVLSVTAPGPALLGPTEKGRRLARALNQEVWDVCQQRPGRFGFFASLPDFNDTEGTIAEIKAIFESEKRANGVVVMTSYGDKLVGDEVFRPIWDELNKHAALVFVHPSHVKITPEKIGGFLPQPVIDYPLATTRAAMSLIVSGVMTYCSKIEVILSHAGGAFPFLAQRGIGALINPTIAEQSKANIIQGRAAMGRFWYDIALSTSEAQLKALLATASSSRIVFGSDFPYAPKLGIYAGLLQYSKFAETAEGSPIRPAELNHNATVLLRAHALENSFLPHDKGEEDMRREPEFGLEENDDAAQAREQLDEH